jgi:acyl-CoA dehydrogenase
MSATVLKQKQSDPSERLAALLPAISARAAEHDAANAFVAEHYAQLKAARLFSVGVPIELGGDGLEPGELAPLLIALAKSCSSTALAFAMHTHLVALFAWRWRNQKAPLDAVLRRVVDGQIGLVTTGGSDWLDSSGTARKVDGGYVVDAVKGFASGVPAGALLNTSAVHDDPEAVATVIHFLAPLDAPGVRIDPTWNALGMRGTASHQVHLEGFFLADAAVLLKRPKGLWHPLYHAMSMISVPLIYAVYYGIAEAARDAALQTVRRKPVTPQLVDLVGEMETELAAARVALADMLAASSGPPGPETTNRVFLDRANFVRAALATVERALEVAGAAGFMRFHPIERLFRDIQAARFHPLTSRPQRDLAGRMALGLAIDGPLTRAA